MARCPAAAPSISVLKLGRSPLFESGTSNPLPIAEMVWAVDDLDGYSSRIEKLEVTGASAYTVNSPTNLTVEDTGSLLRFTGTQNQNSGDPESAVALLFVGGAVTRVTHRSPWAGALRQLAFGAAAAAAGINRIANGVRS